MQAVLSRDVLSSGDERPEGQGRDGSDSPVRRYPSSSAYGIDASFGWPRMVKVTWVRNSMCLTLLVAMLVIDFAPRPAAMFGWCLPAGGIAVKRGLPIERTGMSRRCRC